jgi:hypothetical protein
MFLKWERGGANNMFLGLYIYNLDKRVKLGILISKKRKYKRFLEQTVPFQEIYNRDQK